MAGVRMKVLPVLFAITCMPIFSLAQDADFAVEKQKALEALEMRLAQIQKSKTCITAAQNRETMRDCRESMREDLKEMHQKARRNRQDKKK